LERCLLFIGIFANRGINSNGYAVGEIKMPTRMEVHAAIEQLIARNDAEGKAADVIIAYAFRMRKNAIFATSRSEKVIPVGQSTAIETAEKNIGIYKSPIGNYRLWKECDGLIVFCESPFLDRDTEHPSEYHLYYDEESLLPLCFGVRQDNLLFRIGKCLAVYRSRLEPIYGIPKQTSLGLLFRCHVTYKN
jgi:hypothetical protein